MDVRRRQDLSFRPQAAAELEQVLRGLLARLAFARELVDVNVAAGIASQELEGIED
jgi:hypothetical protein